MDTVVRVFLCSITYLLLLCVQHVSSQTIVDPSLCMFEPRCGRPDGPNTQKYCCAESNGGRPLYKCCNPYIGLIVGLCVGVPVIILIIVGVIVVYCFCVHYQSRKMQRLLLAQRHRRRDTRNDNTYLAPPPYTTADPKTGDSELPAYSATDPYASSNPHPATPTPAAAEEEEQEISNQESSREMVVMENRPLLSDDETES